MTFVESLKAQGVRVEGEFDIQKLFDVWGKVLSNRHGVQITIRGVLKEEAKAKETEKST